MITRRQGPTALYGVLPLPVDMNGTRQVEVPSARLSRNCSQECWSCQRYAGCSNPRTLLSPVMN